MQENNNQPEYDPRRGRGRHAGPESGREAGREHAREHRHAGPEGEYGHELEHHHPGPEHALGHEHVHEHEREHRRPGFEGRGRNFWHEWRDERHHGHPDAFEAGQALSPKEMEAWREFFHQSFGNWPEDHWIFGGRRFSPWHQGMDTFNPFVASLLSKGGGLLPLYVLHLVAQQPRYGNEIMEILAERTNGQWVSNPGAIYPLLTLIEREGFIAGEWADPAKRSVRMYTITETGQAELERIKTIVTPKIEETVSVLEALLQDLKAQPAAPAETSAVDTSPAQPKGAE